MEEEYKFSRFVDENDKRFLHARDSLGKRINICNADRKHKTAYYCEICKAPVSAKFYKDRVSHFAHIPDKKREAEFEKCFDMRREEPVDMSDWHRDKQSLFPVEYTEVFFKGARRADVYIPQKNLVIEFQHSNLKPSVFWARNNFYNNLGIKVIWQYDFDELSSSKYLNYIKPAYYDDIDKQEVEHNKNIIVYKIDKWTYESKFEAQDLFMPQSTENVLLTFEHTYDYKGKTLLFNRRILKVRELDDQYYILYTVEYKDEISLLADYANKNEFLAGAPNEDKLLYNRQKQLELLNKIAFDILEERKQCFGELHDEKGIINFETSHRGKKHIILRGKRNVYLTCNAKMARPNDIEKLIDEELNAISFDTVFIDCNIVDYNCAKEKIGALLASGTFLRNIYILDYDLWDKISVNKNGLLLCPYQKSYTNIGGYGSPSKESCHDCNYFLHLKCRSDGPACNYREKDIYQVVENINEGNVRKLKRNIDGTIKSVEIFDNGIWYLWVTGVSGLLEPNDDDYKIIVTEKINKYNRRIKAEREAREKKEAEEAAKAQERLKKVFARYQEEDVTKKETTETSKEVSNKFMPQKVEKKILCSICGVEKPYSLFSIFDQKENICTVCINSSPIIKERHERAFADAKREKEKVLSECPKCGGKLIKKMGCAGYFLGCENYPKCRYSRSISKQ